MDSRIKKLIAKYLDRQLSDEEAEELIELVKKGNIAIFNEYVMIGFTTDEIELLRQGPDTELWEAISKKIDPPKKTFTLRSWGYMAAAVMALLISLPFILTKGEPKPGSITSTLQQIQPGSDKAVLTLENGNQVALERGQAYTSEKANSNGENLIYKKADPTTHDGEIAYNYLTIPRGGRFFVQLSDGTRVWLNSETQLKYPVKFPENGTREVELVYGEAYFDVAHSSDNNGTLFKVNNPSQTVEVLGTEFNIKAYLNDDSIETTLVEGKVQLVTENGTETLTPSHLAKLQRSSKEVTIATVDPSYNISWRDGLFKFKSEELKEVAKVLSRWYDIDFTFNNETVKTYKIRGVISKNNDMESLLTAIQGTYKMTYTIEDKTIYIE